MKPFKDLLSIVIITYNRSSLLERTLTEILLNSPFSECEITVLNNCSTDNTLEVCEKFQNEVLNRQLSIVTNRFNIGGSANILRATEYGSKKYLWILADDDKYDFSKVDDILAVMNEGNVGLIHVGAREDDPWTIGGQFVCPQDAYERGYPFFRYGSFTPCNIFKRDVFASAIINGYRNIVNSYPHMPFIIDTYTQNKPIYIASNRLVKAGIGAQNYDIFRLVKWWLGTSMLIDDRMTRRRCLFDQFRQVSGRPCPTDCVFEVMSRVKDHKNGIKILYGYFKELTLKQKLKFLIKIPGRAMESITYRIKNR